MIEAKAGLAWAAIVGLALTAGALVPIYGTAVLAALLGLGVVAFSYVRPQAAIVTWVVVTAMVPYWTNVYVSAMGFPPSAAFGLPVLLGAGAAFLMRPQKARLHWMDGALAAGALIIMFLWFSGELQGIYFLRDLLLLWALAYVLGRMMDSRVIATAFPIIMAVVAAWGLLEFAFGLHLFADWMPSTSHTWNRIQERAGVSRSEAAFGHAIAYGAALVLALPYAQRLPRYSLVTQLLLVAGIVVSLSRGPLLGLALTLVLCAWVLSTPQRRVRDTLLTAAGGLAVYFILTNLYSGEYSSEVSSSGDARLDQFFAVRDHLNWLSSAISFTGPEGSPIVAGIAVIDSTPLRLAVNFGIIAAFLALTPVIVAGVRSINRKAGVASVALAGQIPILVVTSFITQWQVLIFFFMGLVTSEVLNAREPDTIPTPSHQEKSDRAQDVPDRLRDIRRSEVVRMQRITEEPQTGRHRVVGPAPRHVQ